MPSYAGMNSSFDQQHPSRIEKYMYYGEKILVRTLIAIAVTGTLLIFWDGWVQGTDQYWSARKTVDICINQKDSIMDSDHLRRTCHSATITQGTYPSVFAVRFVLVTLIDWTITSICHIGGSWLSSGIIGMIFALLMAYTYRRITGPSNPYYQHHYGSVPQAMGGMPLQFHTVPTGHDLGTYNSALVLEYCRASNTPGFPKISELRHTQGKEKVF